MYRDKTRRKKHTLRAAGDPQPPRADALPSSRIEPIAAITRSDLERAASGVL
jgi:hypothetical protein